MIHFNFDHVEAFFVGLPKSDQALIEMIYAKWGHKVTTEFIELALKKEPENRMEDIRESIRKRNIPEAELTNAEFNNRVGYDVVGLLFPQSFDAEVVKLMAACEELKGWKYTNARVQETINNFDPLILHKQEAVDFLRILLKKAISGEEFAKALSREIISVEFVKEKYLDETSRNWVRSLSENDIRFDENGNLLYSRENSTIEIMIPIHQVTKVVTDLIEKEISDHVEGEEEGDELSREQEVAPKGATEA